MTTIGGNHQQLCKKSSTFAPDFKKHYPLGGTHRMD